jgi:hypothetical protein
MLTTLALLVTSLAGFFLLALGVAAIASPGRATTFLLGFATTPSKHFLELGIRVLVGAAFMTAAPQLPFANAFYVFGAVLVVTSCLLALVPWRFHQRFAHRSVTRALRYLNLIGFASIAGGLAILVAIATLLF